MTPALNFCFISSTFRPSIVAAILPAVQRFTIGEECWNPARRCTGVCASPKGDAFAEAWLGAMNAIPDSSWDHWTDQIVCNQLLQSGRYPIDALPTGRLNWPSESGFVGELRLSEDRYILHYFDSTEALTPPRTDSR